MVDRVTTSACFMLTLNGDFYILQIGPYYLINPKFIELLKICCNYFRILKKRFYYGVMPADRRIANSVEPDQTVPTGAVCRGSALFARPICLKTEK